MEATRPHTLSFRLVYLSVRCDVIYIYIYVWSVKKASETVQHIVEKNASRNNTEILKYVTK